MEITLNLQAIVTAILLGGGGLIVFFLRRILVQFEKVADTVTKHNERIVLLEDKVNTQDRKIEKLEEQVQELRRAA